MASKKNSNSAKKGNTKWPFLVGCLLVLCFSLLVILFKNFPLILGDFIFIKDLSNVNLRHFDSNFIFPKVEVSKAVEDIGCDRSSVGGIYNVSWYFKATDGFGSATSWNEDRLIYLNAKDKEGVINFDRGFSILGDYESKSKLQNLIFGHAPDKWNMSFYPLNYINDCWGSYIIPIYAEKVNWPSYDFVYYYETLEGQDDPWIVSPYSSLILKKGKNFLLIKEAAHINNPGDFSKEAESKCEIKNYTYADQFQIFRCVDDVWTRRFRDSSEVKMWIEHNLKRVYFLGR